MIIKDRIKEIIENSLKSALQDGKMDGGSFPPVKVEYPREEKFGDYSTPIALESARIIRRSPIDIGNILKDYIEESDLIEKIEVVKPGFINIFLSLEFLFHNMMTIIEQRGNYGKSKKEYSKRINIEFVSANPTGPLNIVSARAAAIGDTLANLLIASGDSVEREFYINDYGNQFYLLGKSVLLRYKELSGESVVFPEDGYHGEYIKDIAKYLKENYYEKIESYDNLDALIQFIAMKAVEFNVKGQRGDLERFNIKFDRWFSERTLHDDNKVEKTLRYLESIDVIYVEDGKKIFRSTDFGDDKDRVVVRDDGRATYFLADIAYHMDKIDRGYDLLIDIWGPDHHGYISRLAGAMKAVRFESDRFRVLIAQQVNLMMNGEVTRMSKRQGKFSTMSELIDEIGVDVARYFFIMRSMDSHLDFDLVIAKRQSSENPVFYLQYAHARICSIFREATKRGVEYLPSESRIDFLDYSRVIALLKYLAKFPEEVSDAAYNFEPHRMAVYLLKLAKLYHKFYTEHRILSDEVEKSITYLSLCDCVRIVLKNGLQLLGITAPERM